jgi:hypothetical protein
MKKRRTILIIDRDEEPEVSHDILDLISENIQTSLKNPTRNDLAIRAVIFHQG